MKEIAIQLRAIADRIEKYPSKEDLTLIIRDLVILTAQLLEA